MASVARAYQVVAAHHNSHQIAKSLPSFRTSMARNSTAHRQRHNLCATRKTQLHTFEIFSAKGEFHKSGIPPESFEV